MCGFLDFRPDRLDKLRGNYDSYHCRAYPTCIRCLLWPTHNESICRRRRNEVGKDESITILYRQSGIFIRSYYSYRLCFVSFHANGAHSNSWYRLIDGYCHRIHIDYVHGS